MHHDGDASSYNYVFSVFSDFLKVIQRHVSYLLPLPTLFIESLPQQLQTPYYFFHCFYYSYYHERENTTQLTVRAREWYSYHSRYKTSTERYGWVRLSACIADLSCRWKATVLSYLL